MFTTVGRFQQTLGQQVATWSWVLVSALVVLGSGCGPQEGWEQGGAGQLEQGVVVDNGISTNGISTNGISTNGISTNGISTNGLSSQSFRDWFDAEPAVREETMRYIILCAVAEGQSRSYTSSLTGETYTWQGRLGLAPGWASGLRATEQEQQVVSACLAAHVNKLGLHVQISLLGLDGEGARIAYDEQELATYSVQEGCFFGNLFQEEPVHAGNDGLALSSSQSTARVCALPGAGGSAQCAPMGYVGSCAAHCTRSAGSPYYESCTYNGKSYRPITTRLMPAAVATCGDGVCGQSEAQGLYHCPADCG